MSNANSADAGAGARVAAVRWHRVADADALLDAAYGHILAASVAAIAQRGSFLLVLAGGTTPRALYQRLCAADTDWSRWHIYFGDERCLPAVDAGRNSHLAATTWLRQVPIPPRQIHVIPAERGALAAATAYARALRGVGDFDLVLLGLGEDGHTASLFPGRNYGGAPTSADVLAVLDAPKPPPARVSLSAARLSRACAVLFLVEGAAKGTAVARWRAGEALPAAAIKPASGVDVLVTASLLAAP